MNEDRLVSEFTDAFIDALDVLNLRGNLLFGDPGSYAEFRMPPNPSVIAGALRSSLLVAKGIDPAQFARGEVSDPLIGSPTVPGEFTLCEAQPALISAQGDVEPLFGLPADLFVGREGTREIPEPLVPVELPLVLKGSNPLPLVPALPQDAAKKPSKSLRLRAVAWQLYLDAHLDRLAGAPLEQCLVDERDLWANELRVGIGLDPLTGRADDGKLFSGESVVMARNVGLAVRIAGPSLGFQIIRLGGDGRGARVRPAEVRWPETDYNAIAETGRARLILTSPGIFSSGWLPTGASAPNSTSGANFELGGVRGRIVCAAVPKSQVISGFDLARWQPKPAQRSAASGSVYWIDDLCATPEQLRKLAERGLWDQSGYSDSRRAEGYNRFAWGSWNA